MKKILLGMTAYGDHLGLFLKYGLPSLMSNGNLSALAKEREIIINIHTTKDGYKRISDSDLPYRWYGTIDVTDEDKYSQLGHHQHDDLKIAKDMGADYHSLLPDFIYSDNCFTGILKAIERGHKAITRLVVSTVQETITPELNRPRSAIDLATLSFQHPHPGIRNWFITNKGYPRTHVIAWIGKDTLTMCSPHQTIVYAANEVINPVDSDLPVDCILDQVILGDIYCPKPDDGIVIIEISPLDARKPQYECCSIEEFCRVFKWDTKGSLRQLLIFNEETIDLINREAIGGNNYWGESEIEKSKGMVHDALVKVMGG